MTSQSPRTSAIEAGEFRAMHDSIRARFPTILAALAEAERREPQISVMRYVLHSRRAEYEALGWTFAADLGPTHGTYSVLMKWSGKGDPVEP